jgi:hypothetical protein
MEKTRAGPKKGSLRAQCSQKDKARRGGEPQVAQQVQWEEWEEGLHAAKGGMLEIFTSAQTLAPYPISGNQVTVFTGKMSPRLLDKGTAGMDH